MDFGTAGRQFRFVKGQNMKAAIAADEDMQNKVAKTAGLKISA